jgi:ubiquinone/menaquinone biosynthesis C-methylase UbiE
VLDLCTGTAALLPHLHAKVRPAGLVAGVDFSRGMLLVARRKTRELPNLHLVEGDAGALPFAAQAFDVVTCSHAFYELKGETQRIALGEILRVLKPAGAFLMMEHEVPRNLLIKALFYLRLTAVSGGSAVAFLRHEQETLRGSFARVEKVVAPAGRSKVLVCWKSG